MPLRPSLATAVAALFLAGCASATARAPINATEPAAECAVVIPGGGATLAPGRVGAPPSERAPGAAAATDTLGEPITVALTTPVDPAHAPWPRSASERLLFAQLYEPLVRVDCTGRVVAALAHSWSLDSTRVPGLAEWRFVIRDGLRFHGGERVTAAHVIESWRASAAAHAGQPSGGLIAALASGGRALDDSTLMVSLPDSLASPRTFASAALAVARRSPESEWPDGTTSYHVESSIAAGEGSAPARSIALRSSAAPPLRFRIYQQRDARDILDAGVDLLPTASPVAVQYAATESGRALIELPWTRTYTIALPSRDTAGDESPDCATDAARAFRDALATSVHAGARGAEGPFWWTAPRDVPDNGTVAAIPPCPTDTVESAHGEVEQEVSAQHSSAQHSSAQHSSAQHSSAQGASAQGGLSAARTQPSDHTAPRRIVYPRDDSTARELAERIVALAAPGRGEPSVSGLGSVAPEMLNAGGWRAVGLDSLRFAEALARASESAYILPLPRRPASEAFARATLLAAAPWLARPDPPEGRIISLIDTREALIARRARALPPISVDWDGTLIFGPRQHGTVAGAP